MNKPPYNPQNQNTQQATVPSQGAKAPQAGKKKVNPKVVAGAAAGAAVLGVGATAAAMGLGANDDHNDDATDDIDLDVNAEEIEIGDSALNPDQPASGSFHFGLGGNDSASQPAAQHQQAPAHHQAAPQHPAAPAQEEQHIGGHTPGHEEEHFTPGNDEEVDPAEIISITEVDSDDNDMPELLEFEEPEYVDDGAGNIQVHADFTLEGETFTMIDVDGDGTFDGIDNGDGTMAEVNVGGLMVSDVEMMTHENDHDYLAANDLDNNTDVNAAGEASADDTILV